MKNKIMPATPQVFAIPDGYGCGGCKHLPQGECGLFGGNPYGKKYKRKVPECYKAMMEATR